jgi:hypothetical protein
MDSMIYTTAVMGKAKEFGGYASIVASGFKTGAYAKSYKTPQGQYGLDSDITKTARIRTATEGSN